MCHLNKTVNFKAKRFQVKCGYSFYFALEYRNKSRESENYLCLGRMLIQIYTTHKIYNLSTKQVENKEVYWLFSALFCSHDSVRVLRLCVYFVGNEIPVASVTVSMLMLAWINDDQPSYKAVIRAVRRCLDFFSRFTAIYYLSWFLL